MPLSLAVSMSETWRRLVRQSDKNRCNVCEASSINKARGRPAVRPYLPTAGLRRRLFGSDKHFARPLQSVGFVRRGLFPRHRHHRSDDSRHRDLCAEPVLWRRPGTVGRALPARTQPRGTGFRLIVDEKIPGPSKGGPLLNSEFIG